MALYQVVFFQVTVTLKLSNMMNLTRQLGTAGKERLLTYRSQEMKGRLPIPGIKIFMVITQHQKNEDSTGSNTVATYHCGV